MSQTAPSEGLPIAARLAKAGPALRGTLSALGAALAFGATLPLIARAAAGASALSTASLLYAGAALVAAFGSLGRSEQMRLRPQHLPRLFAVALCGAAIGPAALVAGLQRVGGATGSLLLNFEALFTVLLAARLFHEPIGRRVAAALSLMTAAGLWLALGAGGTRSWSLAGAALVLLATFAWALDNALSRPLSEVRPLAVVAAKSTLGAAMTCALALVSHSPGPAPRPAMALLACGALGYGASLALYLRAQRSIGAARTASIFAIAPFWGAALALASSGAAPSAAQLGAALLFALGVWLHASEHHSHAHAHEPLEHEHPHRHDDGHHAHEHAQGVAGEHSHWHAHGALSHEHEHAPDLHHLHHR